MSYEVTLTVVNYNKKPYITRALQSILEQSYRPAEVILFDDCSTDGSELILKEFAEQHDGWVRFIQSQHNLGCPAASVNRALDHVHTELWADMSADDFLHPDCLRHMVAKFSKANYDLLIANVYVVDAAGNEIGRHFAYIPDDSHAAQAILEYRVNSARQKLARTEFVRQIGAYSEVLKTHEDHEFLIRATLNGRVGYCEPAIYYWRRFEGNLTSTMRTNPADWRVAFQYVYDHDYHLLPLIRKLGFWGALRARQAYRTKVGLLSSTNWLVPNLRKTVKKIPGMTRLYQAVKTRSG